jgi:type I restriction enzyme M protein
VGYTRLLAAQQPRQFPPVKNQLIFMADDTKKQLQSQLWNIANTLRGKMGADEFRDYILGFVFYKYLSERMHLFADEILQHDGVKFDEIDEATDDGNEMLAAIKEESVGRLGYFLKPSELFHKLAEKGAQKTGNFILEDLTAVLKHIEASTMGHDSEDDFEGLFEDLDLGSSKLGKTENQKNELIAKVLVHLDQIDFRLADTEADVLGDAYEYLIGQFASGAGKKAGEFYTPQEVSTILAKIVTTGKKKLKSVYDPACGSASLLLRVAKEVPDVGHFYGQEMNPTTYNLARMNMILHGVHYQRFDLKNEDTLEHPAPEHADLRFDAIVANPPFSAKWSASAIHENDNRFSAYGKLAPKTKADFAFVQHMVHHLDDGGTMACVLPHGVLFRGAAEGHIRRYLIEDCNYLDAVIGLPSNIFYGTGIPTCILVLKKQRENPDDILFIDASQGFEKVGNQNELRPEHIDRIIDTFRDRKSIEKFSHVADLSEVAENDYNLNIPRYVDTFDEEEPVDLDEVAAKLTALETEMADTDSVIAGFCQELGIKAPF